MAKTKVADLHCNGLDAMKSRITTLYGRKPPDYAVYRTAERVMIQYADDTARGDVQRKAMARLNPLRGQISGLIDGWRLGKGAFGIAWCKAASAVAGKPDQTPRLNGMQRKAERYDRRVGDALIVAFEDDVPDAEALLADVKKDILDDRIAWARFEYLVTTLGSVCLAMSLMALCTRWTHYDQSEALELWRAAAAGTVGAFFSIVLAIRGRTVLPDLQRAANLTDAVLRIVIGLIAAVVLLGLIRSGAVTLKIGDMSACGPKLAWLNVLIVGFIAGFSERFVPDLLAKVSAQTGAATGNPPNPKSDDNKQPADPARGAKK